MRILLRILVVSALLHAADSQDVDESLVDRPDKNIDFPGCYSDLAKADRNGDGYVKQNEYLNFIQEYGKRICFSTDALTLQQSATFNTLACICRSQEGTSEDCCLGDYAQIPTAGALLPENKQTPGQKNYLTSVCKLTDATIDGQCPPVKYERGVPPAALIAEPAGPSDGLMWGLIAAAVALLLLLCCCCCIWKRQKMRQIEEEEQEQIQEVQNSKIPLQELEQAPVEIPGPHLLRKTRIDPETRDSDMEEGKSNEGGRGIGASGAANAEDSDDEEEVRKRRGGGNLPGSEDNEAMRIPVAPRLPPPEPTPPPPVALNPVPGKELEEDEWDQPGRNIEFPKDSDEMSAGEVPHYEPDGGVNLPDREGKAPLNWKKDWNRPKPEEPDEVDLRKHRIQSGLGQGEVWNKLDADETETSRNAAPKGDVFDWVVQSALGVLDENEQESRL